MEIEDAFDLSIPTTRPRRSRPWATAISYIEKNATDKK